MPITLDTYALTTLDAVKLELGISSATTTHDDLLTQSINEESAAFETAIDRKILSRTYIDFLASKNSRVFPPQYPITEVIKLSFGMDDCLTIAYSGAAIKVIYTINEDGIKFYFWAVDGTQTTSSLSFDTYKSTSVLNTALNLISGLTSTLIYNVPSKYLVPVSAMVLKDEDESDTQKIMFSSDDAENMWVRNNIVGFTNCSEEYKNLLRIEYVAGYTTVPSDISSAIIDAVKYRFAAKGKPTNIKSESITNYSYSLGDTSSEGYSSTYKNVVNKYKRVAIG